VSLRDQILTVDDRKIVPIEIPEWGLTCFVRVMEGSERDRWEEIQITQKWTDVRARLSVATLCDEQGELLFSEADMPLLAKKSGPALDRIFAVALRINRLTTEDIAELKKNSDAIHLSDLSLNSRSHSE
jgi:hypothetical protein